MKTASVRCWVAVTPLLCICWATSAADFTEVKTLRREGLAIYQDGRAKGLSSGALAENNSLALVKFEKAMKLLEAMPDSDAPRQGFSSRRRRVGEPCSNRTPHTARGA